MPEEEKSVNEKRDVTLGRRGFLYTAFGGLLAALAGWIAGAFPDDDEEIAQQGAGLEDAQARIAALEAQVEGLKAALGSGDGSVPLGQLEGEMVDKGRLARAGVAKKDQMVKARSGLHRRHWALRALTALPLD